MGRKNCFRRGGEERSRERKSREARERGGGKGTNNGRTNAGGVNCPETEVTRGGGGGLFKEEVNRQKAVEKKG